MRLPLLATQAPGLPSLPQAIDPTYLSPLPALDAAVSVRLPPLAAPAAAIHEFISFIITTFTSGTDRQITYGDHSFTVKNTSHH